jgi:hypothetical protein
MPGQRALDQLSCLPDGLNLFLVLDQPVSRQARAEQPELCSAHVRQEKPREQVRHAVVDRDRLQRCRAHSLPRRCDRLVRAVLIAPPENESVARDPAHFRFVKNGEHNSGLVLRHDQCAQPLVRDRGKLQHVAPVRRRKQENCVNSAS